MNIKPTIPVTIRSKDRSQFISFAVFTEEEKIECERAASNAEDIAMSTEVDGSGRHFEVVRADHAKIWERQLSNY